LRAKAPVSYQNILLDQVDNILFLAAADHSQACQDPVKINWLNFTGQSSVPETPIGPGNNLLFLAASDHSQACQDPVKINWLNFTGQSSVPDTPNPPPGNKKAD
jgi:hypothetical protein